MSTQPTFGTAEDADIETMWADALQEILTIDAATENWKNQSLPLARIKKVMKSEELILQELERDRHKQAADEEGLQAAVERASNTKFMISGEAPVLMGKACELMIKELTIRAWRHTERNKRKTLQRQDLHAAVGESETYDFLIDFIPRLPSSPGITQMLTNPATAIAGLPQGMIPGGYFAQPGLPQALPLHVPPAGFNFAEGLTAGEAAQFVQQPQDQAALAYQQQQQMQQQQQQQLQQMQQQQQLQQQMQQQQQQQQQQQMQQEQQHLQQQQPELHEQDLGQDTDTTALASGDTQAPQPEHANDPLWVFESSDGHFNDPSSGV